MLKLMGDDYGRHAKDSDFPYFLNGKIFSFVRYVDQETVPGWEDIELIDVDGNKCISNVNDAICLGDGLNYDVFLTDGKVLEEVFAIWGSNLDKEMVVVCTEEDGDFLINKRKVKDIEYRKR